LRASAASMRTGIISGSGRISVSPGPPGSKITGYGRVSSFQAPKRFAAEGAKVVITGRRQAELDKAVAEVGHEAIGVQGDVAKPADLDRLYAKVEQEHGRIDVLFAKAGVSKFAPLGSITEEHFDEMFGINVKGLLFAVQKALPLFADGGSIILNASIMSIKGVAAWSGYSATKAAVRSFARTWTSDLKDRQIRVNTISPGPIDTPGVDAVAGLFGDLKQVKASYASMVPLGRMGSADEIAKVAVFLASDVSSFVAGVELFVDGGLAQI